MDDFLENCKILGFNCLTEFIGKIEGQNIGTTAWKSYPATGGDEGGRIRVTQMRDE